MGLPALLRRAPGYAALRRWRLARLATRWSDDDQRRGEFYSAFVRPGSLCFDVGANLGNRSKVFLSLGARVVAVEPQAECARVLRAAFGREARFTLAEEALGPRPGTGTIRIPEASTIASMSPRWIDAVRGSGRFASYTWDREQAVTITTLDVLIAAHGVPAFVKIDVEGFEAEVVRGLSQPVGALSLEFTPELLDGTFDAIDHLATLGRIELNHAMGESTRLEADAWESAEALKRRFAGRDWTPEDFGDVYVRFPLLEPARSG